MANLLAKLKVSNVKRTASGPGADAAQRARSKLIAAAHEQKQSVEAALKNEPFKVTRKVGGETKDRRFRPWWFKQGKTYYSELRYGTSALVINNGTAIEAGDKLDDLIGVYDLVIEAVGHGELDEQLVQAAAQRGKRGAAKQADEAPAPAARGTARKRA